MRQVLFTIPFTSIHVYGYGMMLFVAFILCSWLAARLARREGINPVRFPDMAIWLFVTGIIGGRVLYIYDEWPAFAHGSWWRFIALWDGGLVFYGAMFGGVLGYFLFYYIVLRKDHVSNWKMAGVAAPCLALGACLGRIGCLLTGCCFGNVACPSCPAIHFPVPNGPNYKFIEQGYEAPLGVLLSPTGHVEGVEAHSGAAGAGVRVGDILLAVNGKPLDEVEGQRVSLDEGLRYALSSGWPRGEEYVHLKVRHEDGQTEDLPPFRAWSLAVHPTQIYESISMALLLFFLLSYYPYKTHDGSVMVLLMLGYGLHRFLNEMLRIDNKIAAFGMTLSQNISILVFAAAALLAFFVWRRPRIDAAAAAVSGQPEQAPLIQA